jgi:hypothetical protein
MTVIAKFQNKIVEIVRVTETVGFSKEKGWVMVCTDFEQPERKKQQFKWIPISTKFEWVREFKFGE